MQSRSLVNCPAKTKGLPEPKRRSRGLVGGWVGLDKLDVFFLCHAANFPRLRRNFCALNEQITSTQPVLSAPVSYLISFLSSSPQLS